MIDSKITGRIFRYRRRWFDERPKLTDALRFVEYYSTASKDDVIGFKREGSFTKILNIKKTPEELLNQCGKNTQYKIKRAEREGVRFEIETNIDAFIDFYNSFVKSKNTTEVLPMLKKDNIYCLKNNLTITKAVFENEILVMHSYITDKESKRVRLLNTASLFRYEDDTLKRNLIGRANRFLHYRDMLYFKDQGIEIYDMGGYAPDTNDSDLKKLNEFKDGFGGELIEESSYVSFPLYIYQRLRIYQKKFLKARLSKNIHRMTYEKKL